MPASEFLLSQKYKRFIKSRAKVEFLEGTTYAGKTTVGIFKFMLMVADSSKKQHIISGLDLGTIEKNLVNKEFGIIENFGDLVSYNAAGRKENTLPHIIFNSPNGQKIIYLLGYDNKTRWKKALGGQYGCLYIDEINIADIEFVREASMRCDYLMGTLNPDNPNLPVYSEFINHSRPLPEYSNDGPPELLKMLDEPAKPGWVWWFFSFEHNKGLSEAKRRQIIERVPPGTKIYKNKILGLRGRTEGLVFQLFDRRLHTLNGAAVHDLIWNPKQKRSEYITEFSAGLDTSYSQKSNDTIAMIYLGITNAGRCIVLRERTFNNKNLDIPLSPSDTVKRFVEFLNECSEAYGTDRYPAARSVFVDSADAATITELKKYKREHGCVYEFVPAYKKTTILDRIHLQLGWMATGCFFVAENCAEYIAELDTYAWSEKDNVPEDANDHLINACQYAWLPFKAKIGRKE